MATNPQRETAIGSDQTTARPLTGRTVLLWLLGFFGVVFVANGVMVHAALSTFDGLETDSAYQAGRRFEQDVANAKAQAARGWDVDAKMTPKADGTTRLDIDVRDASGQPLAGMAASAVFERPTDRRLDRDVAVNEDAPGRFHGNVAIPAGQWDLIIELSRQGEPLFRSKNRVLL